LMTRNPKETRSLSFCSEFESLALKIFISVGQTCWD